MLNEELADPYLNFNFKTLLGPVGMLILGGDKDKSTAAGLQAALDAIPDDPLPNALCVDLKNYADQMQDLYTRCPSSQSGTKKNIQTKLTRYQTAYDGCIQTEAQEQARLAQQAAQQQVDAQKAAAQAAVQQATQQGDRTLLYAAAAGTLVVVGMGLLLLKTVK
jgi:multidrug efflux pump subunit AcrA (membrane-fusion protein)